MREPDTGELNRIKTLYPIGSRVMLDEMPCDPDPMPRGTLGTVRGINALGDLEMAWDNGRSLSLIRGIDKFHKVG